MSDLFNRWSNARSETYKKFARDGILNPNVWARQNPRVAYLLKETYGGWEPASGNIRIKSHGSQFWRNIVRWKFALNHLIQEGNIFEHLPPEEIIPEFRDDGGLLETIAYINVKKNDEGRKVSAFTDIAKYAREDAGFLREQIAEISPNIIICGGTFHFYKMIYADATIEMLGDRLYRNKSVYIIDFYHPGYFRFKGGVKGLYDAFNRAIAQNDVFIKSNIHSFK